MHNLDAVILAAGLSRRMGQNKLLLPLGGTTVLDRFLRGFPHKLFERVIVVWSDPAVAGICGTYPVQLLHNDDPAAGKSRSIRLGLSAGTPEHGVMFAVADQPLLTAATVQRLVEVFRMDQRKIVLPEIDRMRANPVIFPAELRPELARLQGDRGGRELVRRYPERVRPVIFTAGEEFLDIDTPESYREVVAQWQQAD